MGNVAFSGQQSVARRSETPKLKIRSLQEDKKKILFVTSEIADLIKVGGLGDVSASLPRALAQYHDIRVLVPGYRQAMDCGQPVKIVGHVASHAALPPCKLGRIDLPDGLTIYVILCPELYERDGQPYGDADGTDWQDNHLRFAMLGHVAAEIAAGRASISWRPQLVHANDWPSGMVPAYLSWRDIKTPSVFTIHNLRYQGLFSPETATQLGLPGHDFDQSQLMLYGNLSFLKAGILYASHVTTVSKRYAREITSRDEAGDLDVLLKQKADSGILSGILNGIDDSWDPYSDKNLVEGFERSTSEGKAANHRFVQQRFNLDDDLAPLFSVVSRLVHQKGVDLTIEAAEHIIKANGALIIFGKGEAPLEAAVRDLQNRYPGRVGVHIGFNEKDARRIFAASDFLLMPSRYEPCGLSQMYAQRYGCLPIARRTGGLADTIEDGITGFLFDHHNLESYIAAIERALVVYRYKDFHQAMVKKAMVSPCYWQQSVEPYDRLYKQLVDATRSASMLSNL